jgi:site-specific DNA-methyltransferase (adenine-specific)
MSTETIKLSTIKTNKSNPRFIKDEKFEKLVKSIKEFPEMMEKRPIVCVTDTDGSIYPIGGNMRLKALQKLNYKEIPASWVTLADNWTKEQIDEFVIKDNVGFGEWDWDVLANEWDSEKLEEWGLELPFDLNEEDEVESEEDDFEVPDGGTETDIVLGDIFDIGEHRLLCGDSTTTDAFEKLMQGEMADMVVTDPPYNVAYEGKTKDALKIENDSMGNDDFYKFLYDFYTSLSTVVKKGGAIYVWHASSEVINFGKAMVDAGWLLKQQLIWVKNTMVMGRQDYQWKHEPCLYGWLAGASHNWYSDRKQTTVIEWDKPQRNGEHPTMKPIGLFGYQIENSSKQGDLVIDAFGGSGTAMVACEQLKRKARIIEFDPRYCQVIVDRMIKLNPDIKILKNGEPYEAK